MVILRKMVSAVLMTVILFSAATISNADTSLIANSMRTERFEMMWNDATDAERYFFPTEVKAYACGLSTYDFTFFAKVVEGEGLDSEEEITDKVLVAVTVLNRINCKRFPTRSVITTLRRPGQFEVVNRDTGECRCARSLDSEWAIVMAYRLVAEGRFDCHMLYYNSIGFTGYSRAMINYAYFGGNYFSCVPCDCESCSELMPDWDEDEVEMLDESYLVYRPEGVSAHYF